MRHWLTSLGYKPQICSIHARCIDRVEWHLGPRADSPGSNTSMNEARDDESNVMFPCRIRARRAVVGRMECLPDGACVRAQLTYLASHLLRVRCSRLRRLPCTCACSLDLECLLLQICCKWKHPVNPRCFVSTVHVLPRVLLQTALDCLLTMSVTWSAGRAWMDPKSFRL
jgi:hypothetical protein